MVEVAHRNIEVRRERYGVEAEGARGSLPGPRNVEDAVARLRMIEGRYRVLHGNQNQSEPDSAWQASKGEGDDDAGKKKDHVALEPEKATLLGNGIGLSNHGSKVIPSPPVPAFKQGKLIHRPEPELKTHTSYLVFAILPRVWSDEDEQRCRARWPSCGKSSVANGATSGASQNLKKDGGG